MKRTLKRELKALEIAEGEAVGAGGPAGRGAPAPRAGAFGSGRGPSGPRPARARPARDGSLPPVRRAGAGPPRGEEPPGRRAGATPPTDPASDSSGGAEAKEARALRGRGKADEGTRPERDGRRPCRAGAGAPRPPYRQRAGAPAPRPRPTRLETRTKESNAHASVGARKPRRAAKAKGGASLPGREGWAQAHPAPSADPEPPATDSSESVPVGTRKAVSYARAGRSQGKPWWRSAAVLTCKSFVGLGYRGERLIEPPSSWFLPKFPSG